MGRTEHVHRDPYGMGSCRNRAHRMTEHEKKIILGSIAACENIIEYYKKQICFLSNKLQDGCCFEKVKHHKIPIRSK
jgi:hypothetical protein